MKAITVITVVRNDRDGLARTIDSVRGQSFPSIELIVIDGGSTDGTVGVILANEDSIDYWQSRADGGIYDAMNQGLERSTGEWVLFLNAGDTLVDASRLKTAVQVANRSAQADVLYFRAIRPNGHEATGFRRVSAIRIDSVGNHQAVLVRGSVHRRFPFDTRFRIKADREVQLRMYLAGCRMESVSHVLSCFEGGGVSARAIPRKEWENVTICWTHRVGWGATSFAIGMAVTRLSLFGLARLLGLDWERAKSLLAQRPTRIRRRFSSANAV